MRLGFESGETLPRWSYIFNRKIFDYYFLDHMLYYVTFSVLLNFFFFVHAMRVPNPLCHKP